MLDQPRLRAPAQTIGARRCRAEASEQGQPGSPCLSATGGPTASAITMTAAPAAAAPSVGRGVDDADVVSR